MKLIELIHNMILYLRVRISKDFILCLVNYGKKQQSDMYESRPKNKAQD